MEWIILDLAVANFIKLLMSLGEIMFFNRLNGKSQLKEFTASNSLNVT